MTARPYYQALGDGTGVYAGPDDAPVVIALDDARAVLRGLERARANRVARSRAADLSRAIADAEATGLRHVSEPLAAVMVGLTATSPNAAPTPARGATAAGGEHTSPAALSSSLTEA